MKTELKAVEILETLNKIAEAYIKQNPRATFTGFNFDFGISLVNLREALAELQELTQKIDSLEALVDNPNVAMTYREFLKAALNGKIDYTPKG